MRPPRAAIAVPALALALVVGPLTACGAGSDPAASSSVTTETLNPFEQQRFDGVTALLEQLSSTLSTGDAAGLTDLIDPAAAPDFRRRLEAIAADFAGTSASRKGFRSGPLRLKEFRYRVASTDGAEHLLEDDLVQRLEEAGASDTWVTPVDLDYALGGSEAPGLDEPTVTLHGSLTFVRYGDDWKVLGDGGLAPDPSAVDDENPKAPELGPWEFPGLSVADARTAGGTSPVLFYRGADATAASTAKLLSPAIDAVTDFWGEDWPRRVAVVATSSADQFAGLTKTAPEDTAAAAAATVFAMIDKQNKQVIGQRIVLTPAARGLSDPALAVVLRHELVHVAARLATAQNAPLWLTEGVPEYIGRRGTYRDFVDAAPELAAAVAGGDVPKALPSDGAFSVATDEARVAYQSAWSFAAFVAEKFGKQRLRTMYVEVGKGGDTDAEKAAIKKALGVEKSAVIEQWRAWLRAEVR